MKSLLPLLCRLMGKRIVRTWHEVHRLGVWPSFLLQALPGGASIAVRPGFVRQLPGLLRILINKKKHFFIPGASSISRRDPSPSVRSELRARYAGGKERLIVFFGFLYRFKGVD